jgi:hypothetical protein
MISIFLYPPYRNKTEWLADYNKQTKCQMESKSHEEQQHNQPTILAQAKMRRVEKSLDDLLSCVTLPNIRSNGGRMIEVCLSTLDI